ncbi:MAG TPA: VIT family protein [Candidatus Limnocylindrales bacterium]|nr:VIT family protein [Candidatus Limnocylindrales bacterium]
MKKFQSTNQTNAQTPAYEREEHRSHRAPWLRAAILGVNDGIVSTSSIMLGFAATNTSKATILTAGFASLAAGAMSMAAGEYVSVSSQRDSEQADLDIEARELETFADEELEELKQIYISRGLEPALAGEVAKQLHAHDALAAHARDELGIDNEELANPLQASIASASCFAGGSLIPIAAALVLTGYAAVVGVVVVSLLALLVSGAIGARVGGGKKRIAAFRVLLGGGLAMLITYFVGRLVGTAL